MSDRKKRGCGGQFSNLSKVNPPISGAATLGDGLVHRAIAQAQASFLRANNPFGETRPRGGGSKHGREWIRRPGKRRAV